MIDKGDDFQEFRLRVLDVISDVVFVIGSANCFQQVRILTRTLFIYQPFYEKNYF